MPFGAMIVPVMTRFLGIDISMRAAVMPGRAGARVLMTVVIMVQMSFGFCGLCLMIFCWCRALVKAMTARSRMNMAAVLLLRGREENKRGAGE